MLFGSLIAIAIFTMMILMTNFLVDFSNYQEIFKGSYETPWYSQNWLKEPYTNFKLFGYPATFYVTTNGDASQIWIVKEKRVGNKIFWTVDYRMWLTNNNRIVRYGDPFN